MNSELKTQDVEITSGVGQTPDFLDVLLRSDQQRNQGVLLSPEEQHTLIEKQEELINQQELFRTENQATREEEEKEVINNAIVNLKHNNKSIIQGSLTKLAISKLYAVLGLNPNAKEFFPQTSLS